MTDAPFHDRITFIRKGAAITKLIWRQISDNREGAASVIGCIRLAVIEEQWGYVRKYFRSIHVRKPQILIIPSGSNLYEDIVEAALILVLTTLNDLIVMSRGKIADWVHTLDLSYSLSA